MIVLLVVFSKFLVNIWVDERCLGTSSARTVVEIEPSRKHDWADARRVYWRDSRGVYRLTKTMRFGARLPGIRRDVPRPVAEKDGPVLFCREMSCAE